MAEESRDDTGKRLEVACNNLIDIEDISPNSSLDNHQKASQRNTDKPISSILHFAERSTTKGNKIYLYISVCKLHCQRKAFCKFYEPSTFTQLSMKLHLSC